MTVTKAMLDQLRAENSRPQRQLEYTIGGTIETEVAREVSHERAQQIAVGESTLNKALAEFRSQQVYSSHEGLAKAHFNHSH